MWLWLKSLGRAILSLVAPVKTFTQQGLARGIPPVVRWILHVLILLLVGIGLYYLNAYLLARGKSPFFIRGYPELEKWWLVILGFLVYVSAWLSWSIWRLWNANPLEAFDPQIEAAWSEACQALEKAGISLVDTPLFLVLGRPEGKEHALFKAARIELKVSHVPPGELAPLRVYANHDAIYVTCARSCLLGQHAANLAMETPADSAPERLDALEADDGTVVPTGQGRQVLRKVQMMATQRDLRPLQRRLIRHAAGISTTNLLQRTEEVGRLNNALACLCRLIVRDRRPQCPMNGVLILLPLGGTDTDRDAQLTAEVLQRDLAIVRGVMQLHCPQIAIMCDMESIPGFNDFMQRQGKRTSARVGQRFPLECADVQGDALFSTLEKSINNYSVRGLRELVYPLFDVKPAGETNAINRNLYLLLDHMNDRKDRLARILVQGIRGPEGTPLLFGGCYFAATGANEEEQGYVMGVLRRLTEWQNFVQWSDQALQADQKKNQLATMGYIALGLLALLAAAGAGVYFWRLRRPG